MGLFSLLFLPCQPSVAALWSPSSPHLTLTKDIYSFVRIYLYLSVAFFKLWLICAFYSPLAFRVRCFFFCKYPCRAPSEKNPLAWALFLAKAIKEATEIKINECIQMNFINWMPKRLTRVSQGWLDSSWILYFLVHFCVFPFVILVDGTKRLSIATHRVSEWIAPVYFASQRDILH